MVEIKFTGEALWERMERAVEKVNERLRKTVAILEQAKVHVVDRCGSRSFNLRVMAIIDVICHLC